MTPWQEVIGVVLLACAGAGAGYLLSRLPKAYWLLGYVPALLLLVAVGISSLEAFPPFSWLMRYRRESASAAALIPVVFCTVLFQLRQKHAKILLVVLVVAADFHFGVHSFLRPALFEKRHRRFQTIVTEDGVCLQNMDYTCAPAAAVTALRLLGLEAEEGELAILARTVPGSGTNFGLLCKALEKRYGSEGLSCRQVDFTTIDDLKGAGVPIVSVRHYTGVGHSVVVMEVTDKEVVIGDPVAGLKRLSHRSFLGIWNMTGIVLTRDVPAHP